MRFPRALGPLFLVTMLAGCHHDKTSYSPGPPKPPPAFPKAAQTPIDPVLQTAARAEIKTALNSNDELIRAHALETLAEQKMTGWNPEIINALGDSSLLVRKAAALTVGELQITTAADRLPPLLDVEASAKSGDEINAEQLRLAAIFALHRLGNTTYSHEFEKTAFDPHVQVRGDTAFILGLIGDKSAIPLLQDMLHRDTEVNIRLQAAESLWRLGDEQGEEALVEATVSRYASDQMIAALALAQPRDTRLLGNIEGLFSNDYPEVRLVCARAAGMLGSDDGYGIAVEGEKSVDPRHRALAAMAFGSIGRADSQPLLAKLMKDTNPDVRLAAAGAIIAIGQK